MIAEYCTRSEVKCLRVNDDDELTCSLKIYSWDFIVRLDGSDFLIDIEKLKSMMTVAETNCFDFLESMPNTTVKYDTGIQIIRADFYLSIKKNIKQPQRFDQVFLWLSKNKEIGRRFVYENHRYPRFQPGFDLEATACALGEIFSSTAKSATDITMKDIYDSLALKTRTSPWQGEVGPLMIAEIGGNHEGDFEDRKSVV